MARALQPQWRKERRQRMLAAAGGLFARSGYDAVHMADVARAAGVGKPTLYRYFGSKEELFVEVFCDALEELRRRIEDAMACDLTPTASLALIIRTLVEVLARQTETLRLVSGDHPGLAQRWREVFRSRRRPILDALRRVLQQGVASGDFRPLDIEVAPGLILGMIRGGLMAEPHVPKARLADAAIDLILHGGVAGRPLASVLDSCLKSTVTSRNMPRS
jgi:AcrR family transcriptional regulator